MYLTRDRRMKHTPEPWRPAMNLLAAAPQMLEVLKMYEELEADIILHADWNDESSCLPTLTQTQFDKWVEIQGKRNAAIAKAIGGTS